MRALNLSLRGVKVTTFLSVGLMVALVSPVIFARPTHAEGLLPAVKCLVQTLLLSQCSQPVQTNTAPTQQTQNQVAQPSSSAPSSGTSTQPENSGGAVTHSPMASEPVALETPPQITNVPTVTAPTAQLPHSSDYVAFFNTSSKYASPQGGGGGNAFIQASQEGWKVGGLAWYWWIAIIAAITGIISYIRHLYIRRLSVLSNLR